MAYCVNCGDVTREGTNFCAGCGSPLHPTGYVTPVAPPQPDVQPVVNAPQGERTGSGKSLAQIAAIVVLIGFFLPWVSCPGVVVKTSMSGFDMASHGAGGLWIVPIGMVISIVLLLNAKAARDRSSAAIVAALSGAASIAVLVYYWMQFNGAAGPRDELGLNEIVRQSYTLEIGALLSLLGSIGLLIGALIEKSSASKTAGRPSGLNGP